MYLSHLNNDDLLTAKTRLQSQLHLTPVPIPIHLRVPGIAVTITQMSSDKSMNVSYINKCTDDYCEYTTEEETTSEHETSTDLVNYTNYQRPRNGNFKRNTQPFQRNRPPPRMTKQAFKGGCNSCGMKGHHAATCYFLMKVKQCLSYLKDNPNAGQEKAAQFRQQSTSNYKDRRAKIRTLQEDFFIPYDVDPDVIIDCFDDAILAEHETIHLQE